MKTKVIVVDDHPAIISALADVIGERSDLEMAGSARTAEEAFGLIEQKQPHVATVDIGLSDAHGLYFTQNLIARFPDLRIVIFSMYDETIYAERAIRAGASGYLMKSEPTELVVEAIRAVARGEIYLSRRMASRFISKMTRGSTSGPGQSIDVLTDTEMAVFQLLGQGLGIPEIADQLHLSRKTVETYRRNAKEKLGFDSVAALLQYAVRWVWGQAAPGRPTD